MRLRKNGGISSNTLRELLLEKLSELGFDPANRRRNRGGGGGGEGHRPGLPQSYNELGPT